MSQTENASEIFVGPGETGSDTVSEEVARPASKIEEPANYFSYKRVLFSQTECRDSCV